MCMHAGLQLGRIKELHGMGERVARQTVAAPRRSLCVRSARTKQKDNLAMADPFVLTPKLPCRSMKHFRRKTS